jgi:plastocyanin
MGRDHDAYADAIHHARQGYAGDQGIPEGGAMKDRKIGINRPRRRDRGRWFVIFAGAALFSAALLSVLRAQASDPAVVIRMIDTPPSFEPQNVSIRAGDTGEWKNAGSSVHHATDDHEMAISAADVASPNGAIAFDSGFMRPGETFTHKFTKPGIYKYVCVAHEASGMKGEIVVK